eukprot:1933865-Pyramimonas_sp.AAC.1
MLLLHPSVGAIAVLRAHRRGGQGKPSQRHPLLVRASCDLQKLERVEWNYGNGLPDVGCGAHPETYAQLKLLDKASRNTSFTSSLGWHIKAKEQEAPIPLITSGNRKP